MYPIGTRVTVQSVDHLPGGKPSLIGRTGTVIGHENDMNLVAGLTRFDRVTGVRAFADTHLAVAGPGDVPDMPPASRVRGYHLPATPLED